MSTHSPAPMTPPRLTLCLLIFALSLGAALAFAKAFEDAPNFALDPALCGDPAPQGTAPTDSHAPHDKKKTKPLYYAGGLWSPERGLAPLLDATVLATAADRPIVCQSAISKGESLTVIDRSPIRFAPSNSNEGAKPDLVLSIDYTGSISSMEYEGMGPMQQYITDNKENYNRILIVEPLPGPAEDPDPDWGILNFDSDTTITFFTPDPKHNHQHVVQNLYEVLDGSASPPGAIAESIEQLGSSDRAKAAKARLHLKEQSPYRVIPAMSAWVANASEQERAGRVFEAMLVRRAMGVHADELITEATASDNPALRALAARSLGDLADVTTDPLGKLTPLAEDDDMAVRYEALVAARAIPGRRAAGVAQLVEPYEMTDAMRSVYQGTMQELLAYGEPTQADSKANRLRRMAISELLQQERTALVCTILLQRTDLPDDKIDEVLGQLANANGRGPLVALLNLIESMNPRTLAKREVLLQKLVDWKTNELNAQTPRLKEMALGNRTINQRSAAAAAIIQSDTVDGVMKTLGLQSITFNGFAWINDATKLTAWADTITKTALSVDIIEPTRIAALDAIQRLPQSAVTKEMTDTLVALAKQDGAIDLRFAAIRAINALPKSLIPDGIDDLKLTTIKITAIAGMKYDQEKLTVPAGRPVELTLINPDTMEHNLVITLPGRGQEIGIAMSADPTASAAVGYVPKDNDAVLHYTKMTKPGESDTIRFFAPTKADSYEYVCTFPGHYTSMRGVLEVVKP